MFALVRTAAEADRYRRASRAAARAGRRSIGISPARPRACSSACSPPASSSRCSTRMIPVFIGRIVTLITASQPDELFATYLAAAARHGGGAAGRCARSRSRRRTSSPTRRSPPTSSNLIRWQSHWHVVRQSLGVLPERLRRPHRQPRDADRAGDPREPRRAAHRASGTSWSTAPARCVLLASRRPAAGAADRCSGSPATSCCCASSCRACATAPRTMSEARSLLTGPHRRQLHQHPDREAVRARRATRTPMCARRSTSTPACSTRSLRLNTLFGLTLSTLNALLVDRHRRRSRSVLWTRGAGRGRHGRDGAAARLADRQHVRLGRLAGHQHLREHRRRAGRHDDDRAADHAHRPARCARRSRSRAARSRSRTCASATAARPACSTDFTLTVRPGEKIGLVGRSGAGKSTLVNLLLRFFDLEGGRILIDGQDIAAVTQESLRAQISMVTQDTSLLHRSIRDNIRYGRPDATDAEIVAAARLAHAHEFILELEDWKRPRAATTRMSASAASSSPAASASASRSRA